MARNPDDEKFDDRAARAVLEFEKALEKLWDADERLISFTVRLPDFVGGEYLIVARVTRVDENLVAFRSGDSFAEVLTGFVRAMKHGSLKYRKDQYGQGND